jgi:hypothetical protein
MGRRVLLLVTLAAAALVVVGVVLALRGGGRKEQPKRLVAGRDVAVSRLPGPQSETTIAVDPRHPKILLAGSNDVRALRMAVYSSTDGGRHWTRAHLAPPQGVRICEMSDPTVGIDLRGRQYYAFLGLICIDRHLLGVSVYLATRQSAQAPWRILRRPVARPSRLTFEDDHPMLVVDNDPASPNRGRLYVGWTRFNVNPDAFVDPEEQRVELIDAEGLVSHSDDGGRRWSKPTVLSSGGSPLEVRLATAPTGGVYAVWRESTTDAIFVARSADGTTFGRHVFVAGAVVPEGSKSCHRSRARIPAQPKRCVSPNPFVAVDPSDGRVYVTYGSTSLFGTQGVYVASFDPNLNPILGVGEPKQVSPAGGFAGPDAFLPVSALDPRTGRLWACFYESGLRSARKLAHYACTSSADGGKSWSSPRPVARIDSDETVKRANRANGYGDYEGVAALGGVAHAIWTDGRDVRRFGEEVYTASLAAR